MHRISLVGLGVVFVARSLVAQSAGAATALPAVIVVSGTADTTIAADRASLEIAVQTHAATAAEAGHENAQIQRAVVAALVGAGADAAQISTAEYSVSANMKSGGMGKPMKQDGYNADNTIRVAVSRFAQLGAFIDTALASGATRIGDISFSSTAERNARRDVLAQAVANARADADAMARAAGGSLGRLVEVSTERPGPTMNPLRLSEVIVTGSNVETTEITPHPIEVQTTVYARWEFVPKQ
ncbi:MAG TPA: SIMPL domain-containing protein [Gemmatimonadaceae bacterium]|jgi:hypothetical protein